MKAERQRLAFSPVFSGSPHRPRCARGSGNRPFAAAALATGLGLILSACSPDESTPSPATQPSAPETHVECLDRNPLGNPYFGELHVHTTLSFDAWAFDTRAGPDEAYAFARGRPLAL
ncbi:MAG: DUF3604 domain-containing protein, partial [Proteobacteria bacterium]|nr:DUF3604 domain-containing protein [Pseudomonadota bacterium]